MVGDDPISRLEQGGRGWLGFHWVCASCGRTVVSGVPAGGMDPSLVFEGRDCRLVERSPSTSCKGGAGPRVSQNRQQDKKETYLTWHARLSMPSLKPGGVVAWWAWFKC